MTALRSKHLASCKPRPVRLRTSMMAWYGVCCSNAASDSAVNSMAVKPLDSTAEVLFSSFAFMGCACTGVLGCGQARKGGNLTFMLNPVPCWFCGETLDAGDFFRMSGPRPQCLSCHTKITKNYRDRYRQGLSPEKLSRQKQQKKEWKALNATKHREYMKQYQREYRKNNKKPKTQSERASNVKSHRLFVEKQRAFVWGLKRAPCVDCGQCFHPACMDFDHLPGSGKVLDISKMVSQGLSQSRLESELSKCQLVCSNCHRLRTFNRSSKGFTGQNGIPTGFDGENALNAKPDPFCG